MWSNAGKLNTVEVWADKINQFVERREGRKKNTCWIKWRLLKAVKLRHRGNQLPLKTASFGCFKPYVKWHTRCLRGV